MRIGNFGVQVLIVGPPAASISHLVSCLVHTFLPTSFGGGEWKCSHEGKNALALDQWWLAQLRILPFLCNGKTFNISVANILSLESNATHWLTWVERLSLRGNIYIYFDDFKSLKRYCYFVSQFKINLIYVPCLLKSYFMSLQSFNF